MNRNLLNRINHEEFKAALLITSSSKIKSHGDYNIYRMDNIYYASIGKIICTPFFSSYEEVINFLTDNM